MKIGTVKETKKHEYRVGLTPMCARAYIANGHQVFVESGSGVGTGFSDQDYLDAGAKVLPDRDQVFAQAEMIVKVKEPQPDEYACFREGMILYTYLHLAAAEKLTQSLLDRGVSAVAYETIEESGLLPCLRPMSAIAGRLSVQQGAKYLEKPCGGRGILLSGAPGVKPATVAIIGGGVVGLNACRIALGMGADVTVLDINPLKLEEIETMFDGRASTLYSTPDNLDVVLEESDLVIGAVLVAGAKAPKIIRRPHLKKMKPGAVIVDVAVDQGGCAETTKATTHDDPVYVVDQVIHYAVANMPGAVPLTSTRALVGSTLSYGLSIANHGLREACRCSNAIRSGLNLYNGQCVNQQVAESFGLEYFPAEQALGGE